MRSFPADKRLAALRSALERAWRWSALRGVELTREEPLDLLAEAEIELDETDGRTAESARTPRSSPCSPATTSSRRAPGC